MPTKKRSHPCDNTLKRGHFKQSQYQDVCVLNKNTIQDYREKLPNYDWKDGTRLCLRCRLKAIDLARKRQTGLNLAKAVQAGGLPALISTIGMLFSRVPEYCFAAVTLS